MNTIKYNTVQEPPFPAFYPFQGGTIHAYLSKYGDTKLSNWVVHKGAFACQTCKKVLKKGDPVTPVFPMVRENRIKSPAKPSNFVCSHDRGLSRPWKPRKKKTREEQTK
jgi:hypothetical protein